MSMVLVMYIRSVIIQMFIVMNIFTQFSLFGYYSHIWNWGRKNRIIFQKNCMSVFFVWLVVFSFFFLVTKLLRLPYLHNKKHFGGGENLWSMNVDAKQLITKFAFWCHFSKGWTGCKIHDLKCTSSKLKHKHCFRKYFLL